MDDLKKNEPRMSHPWSKNLAGAGRERFARRETYDFTST